MRALCVAASKVPAGTAGEQNSVAQEQTSAAAPNVAVVEARPDLASLLAELRDEYKSVIDSAYCQCDSNDDLLARVERLLNHQVQEDAKK